MYPSLTLSDMPSIELKVGPGATRPSSAYNYARDRGDEGGGFAAGIIIMISYLLVLVTFPLSIWGCVKTIQEYERAVIFRLGKLKAGGAQGPGIIFINPCIDNCNVVDMRSGTFDVPPQEILTRDSVTVTVDAVVNYNVANPVAALCNNDDYNRSTSLLAATTLRNILGTRNLSEILSDRENISMAMHRTLENATKDWGINVDRVEIKDVRLPRDMQRVMAAEAEAAREARAKVIASDGEKQSSQALREAADIMSASPAALQLRYLQTLVTISAENNSTVVFPLPMDLFEAVLAKNDYMEPELDYNPSPRRRKGRDSRNY